jgi:hydrogenase maturation protein HypF
VLAGLLVDAGIETAPALASFARLAPRAPRTTSVGRLFDGVAALVGVAERSRFEGEAAMALEAVARPGAQPYELPVDRGTLDWRPMLRAMHAARDDAVTVASRFHATLSHVVAREAEARGARRVVLSGGCFQNALLLEGAIDALRERAIEPLVAERVPPGDGGLALGQAWVASSARKDSH